MKYDVTVVIPTLGQSPHLRGLLERLLRQRTEFASTEFSFEVLVVANIPQQQLRLLVNSMETNHRISFSYLETGRLGVNFARNKGLERASADVVLFLDDDMILNDDSFIAEHFALHREHESAVCIGGPYKLVGKRSIWDVVYQDMAHDWLRRQTTRNGKTTQLLGGNLSLKRNYVLANGWSFDEAIAFGGAETSLCTRISNAGHDLLFFKELEVGHAPQMTARKFCRKAYLQGAGARWRTSHLPRATTTSINAYLPERRPPSCAYGIVTELYHAFFDFGWHMNPYAKTANPSMPLEINAPAFATFILKQIKPWRRLRSFHRRAYVALRSAWINAAPMPLASKPRQIAPQIESSPAKPEWVGSAKLESNVSPEL